MEIRTLVAFFAHPDDEAFVCGGTLAHYARMGVRIILICATRGEVGEISDPELATPDTLAAVREVELRNAAQAMGVTDLRFLGYRDSGMAGTADNDDPRAFAKAPADEIVPQLVRIIRETQPQVVITFDPQGGYGHPDHIAIHRHAVAAFHAAADASQHPEAGPPWQTARLFYAVFPRSIFRTMRDELAAAGIDTSQFDSMDESGAGWPDDEITATVDVSDHFIAKWAALNAHRTQFGPNHPFRRLPEDVTRRLMSREYFVQAWPEPLPDAPLADLYAGSTQPEAV